MRWFFVFIGGGLVADRWLKWLALSGANHDFGWAQFILLKNEALVFSWPAPNWVAVLLMVIAMAGVGAIARRMWQRGNLIAYGAVLLILAGAASNLYDRLAYGYVIDWAYLGRWWPVFNLSDVLITVGLLLLIYRWSPRLTKIQS